MNKLALLCLFPPLSVEETVSPQPPTFGRLPLAFVENRGQWEGPARFLAAGGGLRAFLSNRGFVLQLLGREPCGSVPSDGHAAEDARHLGIDELRGANLFLWFEGAASAEPVPLDPLPGCHHFLKGNDPARWRTDVPAFGRLRYEGLYPGVAVEFREREGRLEYDLLLETGADLDLLAIRCEGQESMALDGNGALLLQTRLGPLRQGRPETYELGPEGERRPLECRYRLLGRDLFGFEVSGRDPARRLVIDPGLEWSTWLGGTANDRAISVALAPDGGVVVGGQTLSADYPATPGAFETSYNGAAGLPSFIGDAVVAKLSADGSQLLWATYLGGDQNDSLTAVSLGANGEPVVTGWTGSLDFPTTPGAFDTSFNGIGLGTLYGGGDLFVTRLTSNGSALVYSTYIGGSDLEYPLSMALSPAEEATLSGHVHSPDFPTTPGSYDPTWAPFSQCYVTRLAADGASLVFSTYIGGSGEEYGEAMVVHPDGATTIAGGTDSADYPTTPGAYDTSFNGGPGLFAEGFVTTLSPDGSGLLYSTFLGSPGDEAIYGAALGPGGEVTVTGETSSPLFPTTLGAFDTSHNGLKDVFVAKFDPTLSALVYSTFLGSPEDDRGEEVAAESSGTVVVTGNARAGFPTTSGAFAGNAGDADLFVTRVKPDGTGLVYSSFVGGPYWETAYDVALDGTGAATLCGESWSFPTTPGAYDTTSNGNGDGWVCRLDLLPAGVSKYGTSTPGCAGPLPMGVSSLPQVGNASFAVTCQNAPSSGIGFFGLSLLPQVPAIPLAGFLIWISPFSPLFLEIPVGSNALGAAEVPIPIPNDPSLAGFGVFIEFLWADSCAPGGFSNSNALAILVQP
ncbi:MAG TPA: hypothetical protein VFI25_09350 [Planctomycetota bacterium]|jgi:hypothetical protein|nr:hypothetical protein [Planctomycetota bacterium]